MTSVKPQLFLPLIPPPDVDQSDPAGVYTSLAANISTAVPPTGAGLEITIDSPDTLLPPGSYSASLPYSTLYAPASGFVTFYPKSASLPTPDGQAIVVPSEMTALDVGTVIQKIWVQEYKTLKKSVSSPETATTHVALLLVDRASVEAAFKLLLVNIPTKALVKSWKDGGGSGPSPARAALEALYLVRAMTGDASIFVAKGAPVGRAAKISILPQGGTNAIDVGRFVLKSYNVPPSPALPVWTDPQALLDEIVETDSGGANLYDGHPLNDASAPASAIQLKPTFKIWNNSSHAYMALSGCEITLYKIVNGASVQVDTATTASDGVINLTATLSRGQSIKFEASLLMLGHAIGHRTFTDYLATDVEKVRKYLDKSTNTRSGVYQLKYRVNAGYRVFYDELRMVDKNHEWWDERGNAEPGSKESGRNPVAAAFTNSLMDKADDFENYYSGDSSYDASSTATGNAGTDAATFNVLFEGDSWLSYPFPDGQVIDSLSSNLAPRLDDSIFSHLDPKIEQHYSGPTRKYHRVPLQHHGDRSDQMFVIPLGAVEKHQWKYTMDFIDEYKIDLIIVSAGGNDVAEPGMSNHSTGYLMDFSKGPRQDYPGLYTGNVLDPSLIGNPVTWQPLDIINKLEMSFAALLKNHPWNIYLQNRALPPNATPVQQTSAQAMKALLDGFLDQLAFPHAQLPAIVDDDWSQLIDAGMSLRNKFEHILPTFPGSATDPYNQLLQAVFDETRLQQRYDSMLANWKVLLDYVAPRNIQVLGHTYCYPLYRQIPTMTGLGSVHCAGPWFLPRFNEANISSRFVRMLCLRSLIDNNVRLVLDELKGHYPCFDYVDVREMIPDPALWNDEMHLKSAGFKSVADAIFNYAVSHNYLPTP